MRSPERENPIETSVYRNVLIYLPIDGFCFLFCIGLPLLGGCRGPFLQMTLWLLAKLLLCEIMSNGTGNTYCIACFPGRLSAITVKRIYISLSEHSHARRWLLQGTLPGTQYRFPRLGTDRCDGWTWILDAIPALALSLKWRKMGPLWSSAFAPTDTSGLNPD